MASPRSFAALLLAAGVATAHLQLSLSQPQRDDAATLLRKRASIEAGMQVPVEFAFYPYAVNITVGTPPQEQQLALTFGSMDSFVLDTSSICPGVYSDTEDLRVSYDQCQSGSFNISQSDTFGGYSEGQVLHGIYGGESVVGEMMQETVGIGGVEMDYVDIGIAQATRLVTGFLGLGYTYSIAERRSILDDLLWHDAIRSNAFSLWADDRNGSAGSLLLGAVDRSKYSGTLKRVQASKYKETYDATPGYAANVSRIIGSDDTQSTVDDRLSADGFYATISPTTMLTNLPWNVTNSIWDMANATLADNGVWRVVPCNATLTGNVSIEVGGFGGYWLNATLQDLIVPSDVWYREEAVSGRDEPEVMCMFGIQSDPERTYMFNHDSNETWVIGNNFLKDTYMVFDAANMEVSMAPLRRDGGDEESDILEFDGLDAHAPDSEFVGYEECFTYSCSTGNDFDDSYDDGYYGGSSGGSSTPVGVIVGSVVGGVSFIIICLVIWAVLRCRRVRKARAEEEAFAKENLKVLYYGAPMPQQTNEGPAVPQMALPRKPVPTYSNQATQSTEDEVEPIETRRRMSPEPKSIADITPAGTVSPMTTPRDADARSLRDNNGNQRQS